MSTPLRKVEHYRHLTNEFLRLAANYPSIESQTYYLQTGSYGSLTEAAEPSTIWKRLSRDYPLPQFPDDDP
jgi:hypothetical protein